MSENARPDEVLSSIIMFGLIYLLLGAVWLFVLNHKIQVGPAPAASAARPAREGLLEVAAERIGREESLSEAKERAEDDRAPK